MNRQVERRTIQQREPTPAGSDEYKDRLIKMIPGEVVAAYMACNTAITQFKGDYLLYWTVFGIIVALLPFYLQRIMQVTDAFQILIMCIAFVLWCTTIPRPFEHLFGGKADQQQLYSTLALTLFTFAVPIFYKGK